MKEELDQLMHDKQLDALLITGSATHNPAMYYFTGARHVSSGDLIKKRGEAPVLFCNPMERDEAALTGLTTRNLADYRMQELIKEFNGNHVQATAVRYQKMLADVGITSGKIALYGRVEVGPSFAVFSALQSLMPEIELVGEVDNQVLLQARATKSIDEIDHIRHMGHITTTIVGKVVDFLTSQHARDGVLTKPDGSPVTIGEVKARIDLWVADMGAENPEGTIFSMGRDSGVPHSSGNLTEPLRLGKTIIFDFYPCEQGGGYFYDFTRTWCLGYASDDVLRLYDNVHTVYQQLTHELRVGTPTADYQKRACDLFEAQGHPTVQSNPQTQEGYVHTLGHGVGLNIHERPWFSPLFSGNEMVTPYQVFTIEPGLYYPEKGMGVRIEDTVWVRPDGQTEVLATFPYDLVLPIKQ
jgi:Xaa-Pro aminopeptidase